MDSTPIPIDSIVYFKDLDLFEFSDDSCFPNKSFNCRLVNSVDEVVVCRITVKEFESQEPDHLRIFYCDALDVKSLVNETVLDRANRINFRTMMNQSNDFIFFKDKFHVLTAASQTLANITGFDTGESLIGLTDYEIFPLELADDYYRLEKEIYRGDRSFVSEIQPYFDEDGEQGWVHNIKYPIVEDGELVGLFGIARSVTKEIETEHKLKAALEELKKKNEELECIAQTDPLTGLVNRIGIAGSFEKELLRSQRYGIKTSLIMIDIDKFKEVNDLFGHQAGDQILKEVSNVLLDNIRQVDQLGRWGGEEFLIILPETALAGAMTLAEKLRSSVEEFKYTESGNHTVSIGVSTYREGDTQDTLIQRADNAMYRAKGKGRNRVESEISVWPSDYSSFRQ
ncbi:MAG: GGDEF domain-containing protein [Neptuniibacter sp.]